MVFVFVYDHTIEQTDSLFNNKIFKPILLIKIGVHILLHGFPWLLCLCLFCVILDFLQINVTNSLFYLFERQNSILYSSKRCNIGIYVLFIFFCFLLRRRCLFLFGQAAGQNPVVSIGLAHLFFELFDFQLQGLNLVIFLDALSDFLEVLGFDILIYFSELLQFGEQRISIYCFEIEVHAVLDDLLVYTHYLIVNLIDIRICKVEIFLELVIYVVQKNQICIYVVNCRAFLVFLCFQRFD